MIRNLLIVLGASAVILAGCASGSGPGVGGTYDLNKQDALTVKIEAEEIKWNSEPLLEIKIGKEVAGYYTRDSKKGMLIKESAVHDADENLLFNIKASHDGDVRELLITDSQGVEGYIVAEYSGGGPLVTQFSLFDWPLAISTAYARKGGAEGYHQLQWILFQNNLPAMIMETKTYPTSRRDSVMASEALSAESDQVLLLAALSEVLFEQDAKDLARMSQEKAINKTMDQARKQSGLGLSF